MSDRHFRTQNKAQLQMKPAWEHKLEGQVTCIKCRPQEGATSDLAKLAVAAVSGDDISEFNPFQMLRTEFKINKKNSTFIESSTFD